MDKVKLGIVGIGNMGTSHCRWILNGELPEVQLVAVADKREARRQWARENLDPSVVIYEDGDAMIEQADIDAIIVAVPHYDHPYFVMKGLECGKHVMCEKPAGVYTKQVEEMNDAAKKSDKVFAMMFNQRTNHVYRKMRELVQSGEYGQMMRMNWIITDWFRVQTYFDSGDWRATWNGEGGGVLMNQCPHNLDLLQWICGMPAKVQAFCHIGKWHNIEVEDDVTAYLEFPNGATGVFVTSTGDAPGTNRLEITLERAKIVTDGETITMYELEVSSREFCRTCPVVFDYPAGKYVPVETDGLNEQHPAVMRAFLGRILRGEPLVAEGIEGINGLMLGNAMYLSSWLGKPVELPVDGDLYLEMLNEKRRNSVKKQNVVEKMGDTEGTY